MRSIGHGSRKSRSNWSVRIVDLNWMQLETLLTADDRIVLPLGSIEQHAYLSLGTDAILAERLAVEAAEPLGVPVLPAQPFGMTPAFTAYPGSLSLRLETYVALVRDLLGSLRGQGLRRILVLNGHGGNMPAREHVVEPGVRWHDWWCSPRVRAVVDSIDPESSHASWIENFPWTRLPGVELPPGRKPMVERRATEPAAVRRELGDGSFGGVYQRPDEDGLRVWNEGVDEVRELLEHGWET
jgi:creatinine amidohydrolase